MTVTVHVTVLAPPSPALLHWLIVVTGVPCCVVDLFPFGQTAEPLHMIDVAITAKPVGLVGVAGLNVKTFVIVTTHVIVPTPAPAGPTLLH